MDLEEFKLKIKEPMTCVNPLFNDWKFGGRLYSGAFTISPDPVFKKIEANQELVKLVNMGVMEREAAKKLAEELDTHIERLMGSATRKHRIFIAVPAHRCIGETVRDLLEVLEKRNIHIARVDWRTGVVETNHVYAKMITPAMHKEGLRCDECFGFDYDETIRLKYTPYPGYTSLTHVPTYIERIEKETARKMIDKFKNYIEQHYSMDVTYTPKKPAEPAKPTKPTIKNVIFNDPATIVMWSDGTKTVVKAENEPFDPEKGLAMAYVKKFEGNQGNYYNMFRKWKADKSCGTEKKDLVPANLAHKAYQSLVNATSTKRYTKPDLEAAIQEAIGFLGEALED